jgi:BirA family biotin operon repressor/biotin-[acetyl-CoA-carboxylase] ligase
LALLRPFRPRSGTGPLDGALVHLRRTGSTNDAARAAARDGAPAGSAFVAEEQAAGRGRQGRSWTSAPGRSLTLSVLTRVGEAELALLPLVSAVAVCEACEAVAPVGCRIKWPNDVWIDGRKVAGILIEARPQEGWAVLGIGLNTGARRDDLPSELRDTATSLLIAAGAEVDREEVLSALFEHLATRLAELRAGDTSALLDRYRERDVLTGRQVAWIAAGEQREGRVEGIDERGNLVVIADSEQLTLESGEVHLTQNDPKRI